MQKDLKGVLIKPHITEKASMAGESSVYVFVVSADASKKLINKAFVEKYKITPTKIATVTIPAKRVFVRGKIGKKSGYKKAYIYLKKGTKIENI